MKLNEVFKSPDDQKIYVYPKNRIKYGARGKWEISGLYGTTDGTKEEIQDWLRKEFPSKTIIFSNLPRKYKGKG